MKIKLLIFAIMMLFSCKKVNEKPVEKVENNRKKSTVKTFETIDKLDTIILSKRHTTNKITCDLDGDLLDEIAEIVINTKNKKSGLRIVYGNGQRTDYFGMGTDVLKLGFEDLDWAGIFKKVNKNDTYWNNVSDDGEILSEVAIKEIDKIKLPNDGIFLHEAESCGGGIIYLKNNKYEWIQQE